MTTTKVAITIDSSLLAELDRLVAQQVFANRSKAIQEALADKLTRMRRHRLARESAKLSPVDEQALAEEQFEQDSAQWPVY
ncbi:ribbon-helix-helix domain-containing protein [Candidatus Oscillochloris fontis]|uniref:ribbon-helix-helix domain-containing protein n=1 Tax=Candidatus Oscillochloris fontis TaxID=2496868 RepID=UPI00101C295A|nr:ribbon-helix-helix domain-containing protein [Candidatus Oscillochloris fontis]